MTGTSVFVLEGGEQGHRRQHGRGDGDALGDGLGGVAHGVQVGQGLPGLGLQAGHLADAVGVVRNGAEGIHGDVVAGQGQLADAAEGHTVEDAEQRVILVAARPPGCRPLQMMAEAAMEAAMIRMAPTELSSPMPRPLRMVVAGPVLVDLRDLCYRAAVGAGVVVGDLVDGHCQDHADGGGSEEAPVLAVKEAEQSEGGDGHQRGEVVAPVDGLHGVRLALGAAHGVGADDGGENARRADEQREHDPHECPRVASVRNRPRIMAETMVTS